MKTSLKTILYEELKKRGYISQTDLEVICRENNYKISNGERRLRPSENGGDKSPIEENRKGNAIIGYRWLGTQGDLRPVTPEKGITGQNQLFKSPERQIKARSPYEY